MSEVTAYLGLGSNLGDREENLRKSLSLLGDAGEITALSSIYETEPWGYAEQPSFLNLVCGFRTSLSPPELLALVQEVERRLGRVRIHSLRAKDNGRGYPALRRPDCGYA